MNRFSPLIVCLCLAVGVLSPRNASSSVPPKSDAVSPVTEITLQRTWCYGYCPIDEVVLRADGTAAFTGKAYAARTGQFKGTFWDREFAQLSQWLTTQGFFEMKDSYGSDNIDAPDQIISVVRGGKRKTVTNHVGGSLVFWGMERAIRGIAADITWQPESSGIKGVATWRPRTSSEFPGPPAFRALTQKFITVRPAGDKQEFRLSTDENGKFEIALRPGTYTVDIPTFGKSGKITAPTQTVVVQPDKFSEVNFAIDWMAEQVKP